MIKTIGIYIISFLFIIIIIIITKNLPLITYNIKPNMIPTTSINTILPIVTEEIIQPNVTEETTQPIITKTVYDVNKTTPKKTKIANQNILFNRSSFEREFYTDNYNYGYKNDNLNILGREVSPPPKKLDQLYIDALNNAATRWNNLIKFSNDMIDFIDTINDTWSGIEIVGVQIVTEPNPAYATALSFETSTININEGMQEQSMNNRTLNLKMILTIYEDTLITVFKKNLDHVSNIFTHEFGHALGMPIWQTSIPNDISFYYTKNNERLYYSITNLPKTSFAYNELQNNVNLPLIALDSKNYHWANDTTTDSDNNKYLGFVNEVMCPGYQLDIAVDYKYFISKLTIKQLIEIYTNNNNNKIYNYVEIIPDNSEVKNWRVITSTRRLSGISTQKILLS